MTRKKAPLAIQTKKQRINFHKENPNQSQEYIDQYFSSLIEQKIGRTPISNILRDEKEIHSVFN